MYVLKAEDVHEWTERPLCVIQVIRRDGQAAEQAEAINLSRTTNTSIAIVRIDHSFPSVIKVLLNYAEAFRLQYGLPFAEACINDIVDYMMPSRYLSKQSRSSYIRCIRLGPLMTKNGNVFAAAGGGE